MAARRRVFNRLRDKRTTVSTVRVLASATSAGPDRGFGFTGSGASMRGVLQTSRGALPCAPQRLDLMG